MATVSYTDEMSTGTGSGGPDLSPIVRHITSMLADEQWTAGALIDRANDRVREGDLILDDIDPDSVGDDDDPIPRQRIDRGLNALKELGAVEYAHEPTSLYRLVYDPRSIGQCSGGDSS